MMSKEDPSAGTGYVARDGVNTYERCRHREREDTVELGCWCDPNKKNVVELQREGS